MEEGRIKWHRLITGLAMTGSALLKDVLVWWEETAQPVSSCVKDIGQKRGNMIIESLRNLKRLLKRSSCRTIFHVSSLVFRLPKELYSHDRPFLRDSRDFRSIQQSNLATDVGVQERGLKWSVKDTRGRSFMEIRTAYSISKCIWLHTSTVNIIRETNTEHKITKLCS